MATAFLVPMPRAVFYDSNGNPLAAGFVHTYVPGGTVPKLTWQDAGETTPNSNPIELEADGSCLLYGSGSYQITVTDALGNAIPAYSGLSFDAATSAGISPAMQPVVSASTTAAAGALLGVPSVATIAALRAATSATLSSPTYVQGYASGADGGEGIFWLNSADTTSADNGGTIIVDASGRRWYRERNGDPLNLSWFGAQSDGTDCVAAMALAEAALPSGGGEVHLSNGKWTFNSVSTFTFTGSEKTLTISGEGAGATIMLWPSNEGITLIASSAGHTFHFKDLTIRAGSANAGAGVSLNQSSPGGNIKQNDFTRVTFDGTTSTNCFAIAVDVNAYGNINYDGMLIYSNNSKGVRLAGNAATSFQYSIIHNFSMCGFFGCNVGIEYGSYVQGVTLSQTNMTNGTTGIYVPVGTLGDLSQLTVSDCQFGLIGVPILVAGTLDEMMVHDNLFVVADNTTGVDLQGVTNFSNFTGNSFVTNSVTMGTIGFDVQGASADCLITGNTFNGYQTAINLGGASLRWNVQSNHYSNCTTNTANAGTGNIIGGGSP